MPGMIYAVALVLLTTPPNVDVKSLVEQSLAAYKRGEVEQALKLMQSAADARPDDAGIQYSVGVMALQSEKYGVAMTALTKVVAVKPKHYDARFNLGKLLAAAGKPKAAIEHLIAAGKLKPKETAPRMELAVAYLAAGQDSDALKILTSMKPRTAEVVSLLAFAALRQADWAGALKYAVKARKAAPDALRHRLMHATALIHSGDLTGARKILEPMVRSSPATQSNIPYSLALAGFLDGDALTTRRWMNEAVARAPKMFDPDAESFDAMAFPTLSDMALLRWFKSAPGNPRATEARFSKLTLTGRKCHAGVVMETLLRRAINAQRCLTADRNTVMTVKAAIKGKGLTSVTISPRGAAAGCLQKTLSKAPVAAPKGMRCKASFEVRSTR